jgi:hypothetical protein
MSKNDEQKRKSKTYTQFYIKDIQFTELNNHVCWTTEIIYVNKAGYAYITFHTGLGGKNNNLCSFK